MRDQVVLTLPRNPKPGKLTVDALSRIPLAHLQPEPISSARAHASCRQKTSRVLSLGGVQHSTGVLVAIGEVVMR